MDSFLENDSPKLALQKFLQSSQSFLLLIGPSGGGKTTLCDMAIKEWGANFQVLRPVYEDFYSHKELCEFLGKFINMRNMLEIFQQKQKLLFLDDLDTLLTQDRYANTFLLDLIAQRKSGLKILMTCSAGDEKKVSDIKKKIIYERITNPSCVSVCDYLKRQGVVGDDVRHVCLQRYVSIMACNVRSCLLNIELLHEESKAYEHEEVHRITFDKNICDCVRSIFEKRDTSARDLEICLSSDPSLISYIMFDNFRKYLPADKDKYLERIMTVVDAYRIGSTIETLQHGRLDAQLTDICNVYRCGVLKLQVDHVPHNTSAVISYTTVTTRASNHYNMVKRVGEHQSAQGVSYLALLRYFEIEPKQTRSSGCKKHKEDSAINNYLKKIYHGARSCERRIVMRKT